jgi:Sap-like sulfolipid-1-addressing protein
MAEYFALAFLAAVNPTLLAAVTIMLVLPSPQRLLLGYLLGAYMTSITLGLVIVFALEGTAAESSARRTITPVEYIALGLILLVIGAVLARGAGDRLAERRRRRKAAKAAKDGADGDKEPLTERLLGRGSARITFAVGAVLTLPGVSYLTALHRLDVVDPGTAATVLSVVGFNLIMLLLLELPVIGYAIAPDWTRDAVGRFRAWLRRNAHRLAVYGATGIGAVLVVRGVIGLL